MGTVREMTEIAAGNNSILFFTPPWRHHRHIRCFSYSACEEKKEPVTISLVLAVAVGRSITSLLTFGARGESRSVGARTNTCPARKGERERS